jgi:predicted AlkP superfamily pyrophosphatase or phosphodiesterase
MKDRNIVIIVLDTVRKDYFERYADNLIELSDVSFDQTRAPSSWTVPSHASMLTGELPSEHGVHIKNRSFDTLDSTFLNKYNMYEKTGLSSNGHACSTFGFDVHFDKFMDIHPNFRWYTSGADVRQFI